MKLALIILGSAAAGAAAMFALLVNMMMTEGPTPEVVPFAPRVVPDLRYDPDHPSVRAHPAGGWKR